MSTPKTPSEDRLAITGRQCKAARALLGWDQEELARRSGVARPTITNFENGKRVPISATLNQIVRSFMSNGIEFVSSTDEQSKGVILRIA
ncbi:helix-turn-helix transcriptional regulator [Aerophototrophica crusticola]|uniref:Helix-turn-helix transcriptional regulator n=1 Tax=Aerophototrophica crusticola TaxID=1709002 RepID=A0A858RA77_9PROT|nr:helix-turn-helix transcriptional regulator [Rhodospirillaceae bacterium B3]